MMIRGRTRTENKKGYKKKKATTTTPMPRSNSMRLRKIDSCGSSNNVSKWAELINATGKAIRNFEAVSFFWFGWLWLRICCFDVQFNPHENPRYENLMMFFQRNTQHWGTLRLFVKDHVVLTNSQTESVWVHLFHQDLLKFAWVSEEGEW